MFHRTSRIWIGCCFIAAMTLTTGCGSSKTVDKGKDDTLKHIDTKVSPGPETGGGPSGKRNDAVGGPAGKKS